MIRFTSIGVEVVGKSLKRGWCYKLEIPVNYRFYGEDKIVQWLTKKLQTVKKNLNVKFLNV